MKTSNIILLVLGGLLTAFVLKMINLYETTGGVPDTLVSCDPDCPVPCSPAGLTSPHRH